MAVFRCERFPTGEAHIRTTAGIVFFQDGLAVVEDPNTVEALGRVSDAFGIVVSAPTPPSSKRPAKSASVAAWVDWAVSHGMARDQAEDLTKAELIELQGRLAADEEE